MVDPMVLPEPDDDGGADHLRGASLPTMALPATDGSRVDLATRSGRTVVYAFPWTGKPGAEVLAWLRSG